MHQVVISVIGYSIASESIQVLMERAVVGNTLTARMPFLLIGERAPRDPVSLSQDVVGVGAFVLVEALPDLSKHRVVIVHATPDLIHFLADVPNVVGGLFQSGGASL